MESPLQMYAPAAVTINGDSIHKPEEKMDFT